MRYAFIVMIVIYLITYGCSSDKSKTETKPPKKVEKITVEQAQPAAPAPVQEQSALLAEAKAPAQAAPAVEQPGDQQQPENASAAAEPQPSPGQPMAANAQQPIMENPETLLADPEHLFVMPCGRVFVREEVPADLPCMGMPQQDGPLMQEEPAMPQMGPEQGQPQAGPDARREELEAAMQKMVQATNDMVLVTRQMVAATEEMLKAAEAAGAKMDTDKKEMPESGQQQPDQGQEQPPATVEPVVPPQASVPAQPQKEAVIEVTTEANAGSVDQKHLQ